MRRIVTTCALAASAVLVVSAAAPASAAVRPSTAVPTAANGDTVDCVARALPLRLGSTSGSAAIYSDVRLDCSAAADIHRTRFTNVLYEVMPDGALREVGRGGGLSQSPDEPMSFSANSSGFGCSAHGLAGTRNYLLKARVTAKHTVQTTGTPGGWQSTPYVASLAVRGTLTCP